MNFRRELSDEVEINLTPLIDVVFLLLIFFMVTTTFDKNAKIKLNLPTSQNAEVQQDLPDMMEILITSKGTYYVNSQEVLNATPETLFRAMNQELDKYTKKPPVKISSDGAANYQSAITAIDIAGRLGLQNISLATSQSQRQK